MEKRLKGKVALVTGSGGRIGPGVVRRLAAEGAAVAVTDLSPEAAEALAAGVTAQGGRAFAAALDVTDSAQAAAVFEAAERALGPLDILVNNAGLLKYAAPFQQTADADWRKILDVNLNGTIICCKLALGGMIARKRGKIINLASIAGVSGLPGWADYAAAKGGVIAFSRTIAMEAGRYGVTVNCVSPGMILGSDPAENNGTWLGRSGTPEEIAAMIAFLASPEADYITGCNYLVDGGRTVGPKGASWEY